MIDPGSVRLEFRAELIAWRGPAPYHFLPIPEDGCDLLRALGPLVTYGWGVIPVQARIGGTAFETSLFPRSGGYLLPVKDRVRLAERLSLGDHVAVVLTLGRYQRS